MPITQRTLFNPLIYENNTPILECVSIFQNQIKFGILWSLHFN